MLETSARPGTGPGPELPRRIGPLLLTLYGIGVMVGAGIYVLVGTVAVEAGLVSPLVFVAAGLVVAPTALSYAELSVRLPRSAGEAVYVQEAFGSDRAATAVGLAIAGVGITSAAAVLRGGVGYLSSLIEVRFAVAVVVVAAVLVLVAVWGVVESLAVAAVFTAVELAGLVLVIWSGLLAEPSADWTAWSASGELGALLDTASGWNGVGLAVVLAIFAFIGFEDIVNLAEEVKRPARTLPVAIVVSLVTTSLLYVAVATVAVRAVDVADLGASDRPLVLVVGRGGRPGLDSVLAAIAAAAAVNGVLAQIVMAARVLFGLGRHSALVGPLHRTSARFGTPATATVLVGSVVVVAALTVDVAALAEITSQFLLAVFVVMNAALIALQGRGPAVGFSVPRWVPKLGLVTSAVALAVGLAAG